MTRHPRIALALLGALAAAAPLAQAQNGITIYGRVDLSLAQQADAPANK